MTFYRIDSSEVISVKHRNMTLLLSSFAMIILILDSQSAFEATSQGIQLCIQTIIPSLFPFFILSSLLTSSLSGGAFTLLSPVEYVLRIPKGAGTIFLAGILGGYPVGARCLREAYDSKQLSEADACRMLSFCSNAGPSFLFGIIAVFFPDLKYCWALWEIHILSAVITGVLTPGKPEGRAHLRSGNAVSLPQALHGAIRTTAIVCGWVILFRLILSFPCRWFLWAVPDWLRVLSVGLTELSNGCILLDELSPLKVRFIIASALLGFGGLCVTMQTKSIWGSLPFGSYLRGKLLQTAVSTLLAVDYLFLMQPAEFAERIPLLISAHLVFLAGCLILVRRKKKLVAIPV